MSEEKKPKKKSSASPKEHKEPWQEKYASPEERKQRAVSMDYDAWKQQVSAASKDTDVTDVTDVS